MSWESKLLEPPVPDLKSRMEWFIPGITEILEKARTEKTGLTIHRKAFSGDEEVLMGDLVLYAEKFGVNVLFVNEPYETVSS